MGIRLSVAAIERLKPAAARREIADAAKPGLYLVIQPSGRKSWAVRYRINGASRKLTLDGFPSLPIARQLAQSALDAAAQGRDPARAKKIEREGLASKRIEFLLVEFMATHLRRRDGRPIRESTRDETARLLGLKRSADGRTWAARMPKSGVVAHWGSRDVRSISKRDVLDLVAARVAAGAPIAANRTLSALKTFFSWCVARDMLPLSPCDHVQDPSPENGRERALSAEEIAALWHAADSIGFPYGRMVQSLLLTGQRRDEVRKITWGEIDLKSRLWVLPGNRTKNGHEHHVPLADAAIALIKALPRIGPPAGFLFTLAGKVPVSNLARCKRKLDAAVLAELRKIDPAAELKPWHLHDLRHTLKTWMQKARIAKDVRNAVQNHFDGDMDELYGHHSFDEEKRSALEAWARHVTAVVSGAPVANVVPLRSNHVA